MLSLLKTKLPQNFYNHPRELLSGVSVILWITTLIQGSWWSSHFITLWLMGSSKQSRWSPLPACQAEWGSERQEWPPRILDHLIQPFCEDRPRGQSHSSSKKVREWCHRVKEPLNMDQSSCRCFRGLYFVLGHQFKIKETEWDNKIHQLTSQSKLAPAKATRRRLKIKAWSALTGEDEDLGFLFFAHHHSFLEAVFW